MRGNVVLAAVVFAAGLIVAAVVGVLGVRWVVNGAMERFETAVRDHGAAVKDAGGSVRWGVERAGEETGRPISASLKQLSDSMQQLSSRVDDAGKRISRPVVSVESPLPIKEPLKIRGVKDDGSLPVNATIGK